MWRSAQDGARVRSNHSTEVFRPRPGGHTFGVPSSGEPTGAIRTRRRCGMVPPFPLNDRRIHPRRWHLPGCGLRQRPSHRVPGRMAKGKRRGERRRTRTVRHRGGPCHRRGHYPFGVSSTQMLGCPVPPPRGCDWGGGNSTFTMHFVRAYAAGSELSRMIFACQCRHFCYGIGRNVPRSFS